MYLSSCTVTLTPQGVCLSELSASTSTITLTCMTDTTALSWLQQDSNLIPLVYNNFSRPLNVPVQHGVFTVQLTMVSSDGNNYTSIATVSVSSLVNITTLTMTCDDDGDGIGENALLINGIINIVQHLRKGNGLGTCMYV